MSKRLPNISTVKHEVHYAKAVTIAAALTFDEGILLCADTKHTFPGAMQLESTKIFTKGYDDARSVFVISGIVDHAVAALQAAEHRLDLLLPHLRTLERMKEVTELALTSHYERHIYPHPEPKPAFLLYVALCARVGSSPRVAVFRTHETVLRELVDGYDCDGTGAYLGHYLMRDRYLKARRENGRQLPTVFDVAVKALHHSKDYDDGCGKTTEVVVLYDDGRLTEKQRIPRDTPQEWKRTLRQLDLT